MNKAVVCLSPNFPSETNEKYKLKMGKKYKDQCKIQTGKF